MQKSNVLLSTRGLTTVAILIAMAVVLKSFLSLETWNFRFTFYDIPMVFIGILFGPIIGGISGIIVDFFHMMFSPYAFSFNVFTVSNMVWAVIPGVLLFRKKLSMPVLIFAIVTSSIITFSLNSYGIQQFRGMGELMATLPYRIAVTIIKWPIQIYAIKEIHSRVLQSKQLKLLNARSL